MLATSLVRSIGAQNSPSGINSLPSDQLHPSETAAPHAATSGLLAQMVQAAGVVSLVILAGWQKSDPNNGLVLSLVLSPVFIISHLHSPVVAALQLSSKM
jgi:hypothetical protein